MTLVEAKNEYIRFHKLRYSTPKTIQNYSDILSNFISYIGDKEIENLSYSDISIYQEWLYDKKLSKSTVATYLRHLKAFIRYFESIDVLQPETISKRIKLPSKSQRVVDLFSQEDVKTILNAIDINIEWLRVRNILIFCLMYDSGLRQAEVTKIMRNDLMLDTCIIRVHGKGDKDRLVPIGSFTREQFEKYLLLCPFNKDYVFCNKSGEQLSTNTIKQFMYDLKVKTGFENLSSHKLRHNFATNYCIDCYSKNEKVDVYKLMVILGHNDIKTTRIYLHMANEYIISGKFDSHLDSFISH